MVIFQFANCNQLPEAISAQTRRASILSDGRNSGPYVVQRSVGPKQRFLIWDDHPQWLFWWKQVSKLQERCWFFHQVPSYSMIFHQVPSYSFISHDFPIKLLYIFNGCISPGGDADRSTSCWVWGPLEDLMKLWDKPSIYIYIYHGMLQP